MLHHTQQGHAARAMQGTASSDPVQPSYEQQDKTFLLCGSAVEALGNPRLLYPSSSAPALSHTAAQQGGFAEEVWQE